MKSPGGTTEISVEADDGVCAVCLRVNASEQLESEQLALFHQALRAPERLALTLDRLSTRLGPKAVWRVELTEDAQPEHAFVLLEHLESGSVAAVADSRHIADAPRPLCLLAQPQQIRMDWPEQCDCPRSIELRGEKIGVSAVSACERIETGWWREAYARRDYFQVDCSNGARYWVFKELEDGTWFLQGAFS